MGGRFGGWVGGLLLGVGGGQAPLEAPPNPLPFEYLEGQTAPRREVRDPCIVREGGRWYLVFTMWPFRNREERHLGDPDQGSSPGIALYASEDLGNWRFQNWLVKSSELPETCPYKHRFWAPEIHKIGGRFYLIFTADNWLRPEHNPAGNWGAAGYAFVGVADRIAGPYRHITYIPGAACDTTLFADDRGRTFAVIPRGGIDLQEIDLGRLEEGRAVLKGKPRRIVEAANGDIGLPASPEYLEGPWVRRAGSRYVLFYAALYRDRGHPEFLGYWTAAAYADAPEGAWRKDPRGRVFLGGHLSVFDGPGGRPWFAYRHEKLDRYRGLLCVDPVDFEEGGRVVASEPSIGTRGAVRR